MFTVQTMEPMDVSGDSYISEKNEAGAINPFRQDSCHMGTQIGTNLTMMFMNFEKDNCDYIILINTITGERIEINITN